MRGESSRLRKRPPIVASSDEEDDPRASSVSPPKRRRGNVQAQPPPPPRRERQRRGQPVLEEEAEDDHSASNSTHLGDSDLDILNSSEEETNGNGRVGEEDEDNEDADLDDLVSDEGDMEGEEDGELNGGNVRYRPEYERGDDGYVAGSITRIKMTNFMTYDHVEFNPGPHLNMILGPNGTGKSSIAAAIAIGLGFPPKVMGRANELKAYVKQGADEATVEIELKGKRGKRNTVVQRKFNREDEKSQWRLNGELTTRRDVLERVQRSGIQANNLCSFLPQDKVAEFAKMAPVAVLKETMRAAGDPRLTKWHESLCEKGVTAKQIQASLEGHTAARDRLQTQADSLAPDVAHVQERESREKEAEILSYLVRIAEHEELKKEFNEAKKDYEALQRKADKLKMRRRPLLELNEHWEKKDQKADAKLRSFEDKFTEGLQDTRRKLNHVEEVASKGRTVDDKLMQLRRIHERKEDEKRRIKDQIQTAQAVLNEPREDYDSRVREQAREKNELAVKARQMQVQIEELADEYKDSQRMLDDLNNEVTALSARQTQMENIEIQKERLARDLDPSIGFLLDWLKKEEHTLEAKVHRPPMISVSVTNKQYADQVESCTSLVQRKTFVCTSPADHQRLLELNGKTYPASRRSDGTLVPEGKVGLYLAYTEVSDANVNPPRPCDVRTLQRYGCDGFAIDFIEADPAIIAYLSQNARMHTTAVTLKKLDQVDGDGLIKNGIRTWAAKDGGMRTVQSQYGRKDHVQSTTEVAPSKAFNRSVDREAVTRIVEEIARKKKIKLDRETPHSQLKAKVDKLHGEREDIKREMQTIDRSITEMKSKVKRYQTASSDIDTLTRKLRKLESEPTQDEQRAHLKQEKLKLAKARLGPLDLWQKSCERVIAHASGIIASSFTGLQSKVNYHTVHHRLQEGTEETRRIVEAADTGKDNAKLRMNRKWDEITSNIRQAPRDVKDAVSERGKTGLLPSAGELRDSLETIKAQLQLAVNIPGNVVARYNQLVKQLDAAQKTVEDQESELNQVRRDLKKTLDQFDPALDQLVQAVSAKFSAAFARVRCQGEVRIRRVEGDFAAWGIEILVSYRDGDSLAILTGSHQSGGERSLATVTYLMSLSEMSRTPFSLVDEINQGMDQRAERAVHNQLVEVTCDADAGQYFLITPKLLTGLTYHPKMKVLIINNGTYLPDSRDQKQRYGDLNKCLKRFQRSRGIAAH
ncbi:hypothetical protein I317_02191 [Kwoniella heveanensis CBS 569]|nr:hypothetical protein I317_02191 [Kwoniella heveanensis CBS 569]